METMAPRSRWLPRLRTISLVSLGLALGGCFQRPMVPPSLPGVLTTAETIPEGSVAIHSSVGTHIALFGPGVLAGGVGARLGLDEDLELVIDGSALGIREESVAGEHRGIYSGRLGVKRAYSRRVSVLGGVGFGVSPAAGVFTGLDGGLVTSHEGRHFVPYLAILGFVGMPIVAWDVDTGTGNDAPGEVIGRAATTFGVVADLGFRIVFDRARRFGWLNSFVFTTLIDGRGGTLEENHGFFTFGAMTAFEVRFDRVDP